MKITHTLRQFLSTEQILTEFEPNSTYTKDKSYAPHQLPTLVVIPTTETQVQQCLKAATAHNLDVVVRGAGTGTTGGALSDGGMVIALEKLNQILDIDTQNRMVVTQPGVITGNLQSAVEKKGLFYPPDPASLNTCTIGGNVAENAGGPRAVKYGVTKDYVVGLSGFYVDGTPFSFGGKLVKNVAGYDLIHLLVGSEGTLAIITQITLKLIPLPAFQGHIWASFTQPADALEALQTIMAAGLTVSSAEFMDSFAVNASQNDLGISLIDTTANAHLLIQVDGESQSQTAQNLSAVVTMIPKQNLVDIQTPKDASRLWDIRRNISPALRRVGLEKVSEDIVIPPAKIAAFMERCYTLSHTLGIKILGYGHLGDGNIHVNILRQTLSQTEWHTKKEIAIDAVFKLAIELGGSITGEHGVGLTKKAYLPLVFSDIDIAVMKNIKRAFDPDNRLNPNKIFP